MRSVRVGFLGIVAMSLASAAQPTGQPACNPETRESYGLLGPVKSVEVESLQPDGWRVLTEKYLFDRAGRVLEGRGLTSADDSEHLQYQVFRSRYARKGPNYEIDDFGIDPAKGETPIDLQRHLVKFDLRHRCMEQLDIDSDGSVNNKSSYVRQSRRSCPRDRPKWGQLSLSRSKSNLPPGSQTGLRACH